VTISAYLFISFDPPLLQFPREFSILDQSIANVHYSPPAPDAGEPSVPHPFDSARLF